MTNRKDWPLAYSLSVEKWSEENLRRLAALGITEIELSHSKFQPFYDIGFTAHSQELAALARACGVNISSIHLPFSPFSMIDPSDADPEHRAFILEKQGELIAAAARAGIPLAVIHPSGEPYPEEERAERLERSIGILAELSGYAGALGMVLAVENIPRTCLCRTSEEMLLILQRVPSLRVCFDTNHCLMEDNTHYIRAVGDKLVTLHVSDYDFINERHFLPTEGKNDWESILSALEEANYKGRFLYEVMSDYSFESVAENYKKLI